MSPKKHLSQYFLKSRSYLSKIAQAVCVDGQSRLLEIGAGKAELTEFLVEKGVPVTCVEIDPALCHILNEKLGHIPHVSVVCKDIRDISDITPDTVVVGNVPYHISFEILEFLVRNKAKVRRAYLTLQKEFARKITASPGKKEFGYLSCFLQMHARVRLLFTIPKSCFHPGPKVDSATVEIIFDKAQDLGLKDEPGFLDFLRKVFSQRRKKISNILGGFYPGKDIKQVLKSCAVSADLRPERIPLDKLASIFNSISQT